MKCLNEECDCEDILARGYCCGCYHRLMKRGTLKRANVVNTGLCKADGCAEKAFAKNLCPKHYAQADHPMKQAWKNLRTRYPGQFPDKWDDFSAFLADLPPHQTEKSQLRRTRPDEPWSASNMHWKKPQAGVRTDYHSEYNKAWSDEAKYGVSTARRAEMLAAQDGKCAICRREETTVNPNHPERKPRRLSIDHCHKTEMVRGLLCTGCNTMIGKRGANDSVERLKAAIAYLEFHHQGEKE